MPLTAIVGQTGSGKSSIAKQICADLKEEDVKTIVLDPMLDPEWKNCADDVFTNTESFLATVKKNRNIVFFVDESDEAIGVQQTVELRRECWWLGKRSRHNGHSGFFIMQNFTDIENPIRKNLSEVIIFNSHPKECEEWAKMFNDKDLLKASELPMLSFLKKTRGKSVTRGKVTFDK